MDSLTLFVLSDLHAYDGSLKHDPVPSFFDISKPASDGGDNPIQDLKSLITQKSSEIKADSRPSTIRKLLLRACSARRARAESQSQV
jgi:hypothetical protein